MSKKLRGGRSSFSWLRPAWQQAWHRGLWRRFWFVILAALFLWLSSMFAVGQWYIHRHKGEPLILGATFIDDYAQSFGLDPKETLNAMLDDLKFRQVRLVSYWKDIEKTPGTYDFSSLDWQFDMANKYGAKVSLSIGLRQPRWPECQEPDWAKNEPKNVWQPQLYRFMETVINHYKNNPALKDYELENEYFLTVFGQCTDFDRNRLISEYNLVKAMDPDHKIIVSRSNNWVGIPIDKPTPDVFAVSVYKRVWDATLTHRYFEYPLPAWFYSALAGYEELYSGKDMIIHELQAEPWTPNGLDITQISKKEMYKSMSPARLRDRIEYGEATGMRTIDLWGAEWWYYMKVKQNNPDPWNVVKDEVARANAQNQKLTAN